MTDRPKFQIPDDSKQAMRAAGLSDADLQLTEDMIGHAASEAIGTMTRIAMSCGEPHLIGTIFLNTCMLVGRAAVLSSAMFEEDGGAVRHV